MLFFFNKEDGMLLNNLYLFVIDLAKVTRTEQTEILSKLTPEIIDLKFTQTENDPYRNEPNSTQTFFA